jgi:antitoxin VapB
MNMSTISSRIFKNGNSQAVRIPQEFRLDAQRVEISRTVDGDLLIHPIIEKRGQQLLALLSEFDDEYIEILEKNLASAHPMQERDSL